MKIFSSLLVPYFDANQSLELVRITDNDLWPAKAGDKRFVHVVQTANYLGSVKQFNENINFTCI